MIFSTIKGFPWQAISTVFSPVYDFGSLKIVNIHFSLNPSFKAISPINKSFLEKSPRLIFSAISMALVPDIRITDIAP